MLVSKSFDKSLLIIACFVLVLFGLMYTIAINSFKDGKFTCNKYLLNTYLYIILTFNILIITKTYVDILVFLLIGIIK